MRTVPVVLSRTSTLLLLAASATLLAPAFSHTAGQVGAQDLPTIREKAAHMESEDGFIPIHFDPADGRLYLEVSLPGEEFLYHSLMASGAGLALARGWGCPCCLW